jgi:ferredoxin
MRKIACEIRKECSGGRIVAHIDIGARPGWGKFNPPALIPRLQTLPMPIDPTPPAPTPQTIFSARVEADGSTFEAPASLPLLQSAERAGVTLAASSCRNGTCRSCICKLVSGRVVYRIDWPGLSLDEKSEGCILPCVAYPASDVLIGRVC